MDLRFRRQTCDIFTRALHCLSKIRLADDVVSGKYGGGSMARDLPGKFRVHASPYHVANRRASEVVRRLAREAGFLAVSLPDFSKLSHLLALPVEDIRAVHSTG